MTDLRQRGKKPVTSTGYHELKPGLTKVVLTAGQGQQHPKTNDTVLVHYVGQLSSGKVFDSSRKRGVPFAFELGKGKVIDGWEHAIATMLRGEKSLIVCAPQFGYGDTEMDGIPSGSTLEFEVELLDFYDETSKKGSGQTQNDDKWMKEQQQRFAHVRRPRKDEDPTAGFDTVALLIVLLVLFWAAVHSNSLHRPYMPW